MIFDGLVTVATFAGMIAVVGWGTRSRDRRYRRRLDRADRYERDGWA